MRRLILFVALLTTLVTALGPLTARADAAGPPPRRPVVVVAGLLQT
jgi:hypothetical protein